MLGADSLGPADLSSYSLRSGRHYFQLLVIMLTHNTFRVSAS